MRRRDRFIALVADALLALFAIYAAIFIRFENLMVNDKWFDTLRTTSYFIVTAYLMVLFWTAGLYRRVPRYASTGELWLIVSRTSVAFGTAMTVALVTGGVVLSRSIMFISWLLTIMLVGGWRWTLRLWHERRSGPPGRQVVIVGAGDAGEMVQRHVSRAPGYDVIGYVDEDPDKAGLTIHGATVLGTLDLLPALSPDVVVITEHKPSLVRRIVEQCDMAKTSVRLLPTASSIMDGRIQVNSIPEVRIEDLLERAPVNVDLEPVRHYIEGQMVMVTGAGGSIGSEICRQVARYKPANLVLVGRGENSIYEIALDLKDVRYTPVIADIRDRQRMSRIMEKLRPSVVFHAAAHKHVPLMESNVTEAVSVNVLGTHTLMELAEAHGTERFILLSTDKAVSPSSMMGASKRMAELLLKARAGRASRTRFSAVRFGNVLGSRGSVVPTFRRQIAQGGPVTITHPEMTRYFMTIPEAVALVLQAASIAHSGELFILDMGDPVRILDLARNMIRLSGFEPDKDITIQVLGTRPGEKLTEELLNRNEQAMPTQIPKIMLVQAPVVNLADVSEWLTQLETAVRMDDAQTLRALLTEFAAVPTGMA